MKPTSATRARNTAAVDQIVRRCGKLGTTLTMSGREMIVWTKP